jgi:hypothetical protein
LGCRLGLDCDRSMIEVGLSSRGQRVGR